MRVLAGLEPQNVFHFFEEITRIPHGSGNMEQISDYLVNFARERGLFWEQDALKNVIIIKEATPGYEQEPAVILQGHMDMVAVKKPDCKKDMLLEGLDVAVEGDSIYAKGTSLGGDDGIAVAYALAVLDSAELRHPRLEVVLTVDEETGLDGAREIDLGALQGHRLLNMDSEEEGIFLTGCAGGARVDCCIPLTRQELKGVACQVKVHGLQGGHSGAEIHKERGNSNVLMGRLLQVLAEKIPVAVKELGGGLADNAIPRETSAVLVIPAKDFALLEETVKTVEDQWRGELSSKDPDVKIGLEKMAEGTYSCVAPEDSRKAAAFLTALPNGVQAMSADVAGLVETSLNMGMLELLETAGQCEPASSGHDGGTYLTASFSVRSSVESAKEALIHKLRAVTFLAGGMVSVRGAYPGWKYRADSPLRDKMVALYERMYGVKPKVEAIHAGLECGILGSKIQDLDCVSFGPNMYDIHTTEERLSISSTARVWEYLVALLEEKDR